MYLNSLVVLQFIFLSYLPIKIFGHSITDDERDKFLYGQFPQGFRFGFASSSYQIEGGYDSHGKGRSNWDEFVTRPGVVADNSTGNIACDSYGKFKEDVQLLKNAGAHYYRFSLSWARILPDGTINNINEAGIQYYSNLIDELLANGIDPMVTLYHWDLPWALEQQGGWLNETIIEHFKNYSRLVYEKFGDRVKQWITFNEPAIFTFYYTEGHVAGIDGGNSWGVYLAAHNVLKSHAEAYRLYESEFKPDQKGACGITLDSSWYEPLDPNNPEDEIAAERARLFKHGWFGFPVFFGRYPEIMRQFIDGKGTNPEGNSRLPEFDEIWSEKLKGSLDFLGFNHYTTELVTNGTHTDEESWSQDQNLQWSRDPSWESAASPWLRVVPWGLRRMLEWIKNTYENPEIMITENGFSDNHTIGLHDERRINYYTLYINEVLKAVTLDQCRVTAYTAWSILDNFEWGMGYTERFGVHWVNFTDPDRPRYPKDSVGVLKKIFQDNGFPKNSGNLSILNSFLFCITFTTSIIFLNSVY